MFIKTNSSFSSPPQSWSQAVLCVSTPIPAKQVLSSYTINRGFKMSFYILGKSLGCDLGFFLRKVTWSFQLVFRFITIFNLKTCDITWVVMCCDCISFSKIHICTGDFFWGMKKKSLSRLTFEKLKSFKYQTNHNNAVFSDACVNPEESLRHRYVPWLPFESLRLLFYEAKVPFSERCIAL